MGKIAYAAWVDDVAGKVGNAVFQRGKAGNTIRKRSIPINPRTTAQIAARALMTTYSKNWRGLTEAQRTAWDNAAASPEWTQTDTFGNPFQLSGEQLYLKLNLNLADISATPITSPPTKAEFTAIALGAVTIAVTGPAFTVAFTGTLDSSETLVLSASPQGSQGIMSAKTVRFAQIMDYTSTSPIDAQSAYEAVFGTPVEGQKIFVRLEMVSETSGERILIGEGSDIVAS